MKNKLRTIYEQLSTEGDWESIIELGRALSCSVAFNYQFIGPSDFRTLGCELDYWVDSIKRNPEFELV